jgi:hypothetical protein
MYSRPVSNQLTIRSFETDACVICIAFREYDAESIQVYYYRFITFRLPFRFLR